MASSFRTTHSHSHKKTKLIVDIRKQLNHRRFQELMLLELKYTSLWEEIQLIKVRQTAMTFSFAFSTCPGCWRPAK